MIRRLIDNWHANQSVESITAPMAKIRSKLEKKAKAHVSYAEHHTTAAGEHARLAGFHGQEAGRVNKAVEKYGEFVF